MLTRLLSQRACFCRPLRVAAAAALLAATSVARSAPAPAPAPALAAPPGQQRHVPSPDWRDQVIYFVMTDRFDDGDPGNNDQGAGEFKPSSNAHYSGGDFKGLQRRLAYIKGLGATALWITPPVANQWWDASVQYSGYHGYWAENFSTVDAHLGTLADYRALADGLHGAGMYLVQDIVVNHTGNYFKCPAKPEPGDASRGCRPTLAGSAVMAAPSQSPFNQNDARNPAHRRAGIYHWTPDVLDFGQRQQVLTYQMSGLDDLNTENPQVRRALRQSYGQWIKDVGVDAFRVDTAFYVPPAYFTDFLYSRDAQAPGIAQVARQTGRRDFHVFGEGFGIDKPFEDKQARAIERYVRGPKAEPRLGGMLNFPLYASLGDVMARGAPTAVLGHRIQNMMQVHRQPHRMATFVDNHDVDRFLAGGSVAGLRQALLALMTLPGIPVIYYGTEQGFTEQRGAMFAGGFAGGGRDHFDIDAPLYRLLQRLTTLRREHRLFSRGVPTVLQTSALGPGVLAWRMQHGQQAALVVLNTADAPVLMTGLPTGLAAGVALQPVLALDGEATPARTAAGGLVHLTLPARSGQVWRLPAPNQAAAAAGSSVIPPANAVTLNRVRLDTASQTLRVSGRAPAGQSIALVIDGQLNVAPQVEAGRDGRWQAQLSTAQLAETRAPHTVVAWATGPQIASPPRQFQIKRPWALVADVTDAAGDDTGPDGRYQYPGDVSWGANRQLDLRRAKVWRAGGALKIELTMQGMTQSWQPQNGFDHVAFTLFFSQAGRSDGATAMPLQHASLPQGLRWQHRLRVHGWSNALFSADGADAEHEGGAVSPGASLLANPSRRTLLLTLPDGALGPAAALDGMTIYLSTWDYDGGYRGLNWQAGPHQFGGGPPDGARVMDDLLVTLPR